jgi:hypothetical protein
MVEFDQAQEIQNLLAALADPYGDQGFLREEDQFRGDEITALADDQMVDPLSYFTNLDPENLYTRESMVEQSEADRMQSLQDLLGGGTASIQRAEDALGSGALSITGTPEDLIERLTGQKDVMMGEAERVRDKRIADEAAAQINIQFPDIGDSSPGAPTPFNPSITELSNSINDLQNEINELQDQMSLHNDYQAGVNYIMSDEFEGDQQNALQEHMREFAEMGYQDPGIFGHYFTEGQLNAAQDKLDQYQQHQQQQILSNTSPGSDPTGISNMTDSEIEDLKQELNVDDDFMQEIINAIYPPYVPTTNIPATGSGGTNTGSGGTYGSTNIGTSGETGLGYSYGD